MSTPIIPQRSPAEMPMPQQSTAPKFKGHWSEVADFLLQCDQLFVHFNVTTDADRCRFMHSYCDRPTREVIEGLPSFINPDWNKLKALVLKIFDAERATQKFTLFDLHSFILRSCTLPLSTLDAFRDYMRQYMRIAGWLLGQHKIDQVEYNRCFWLGIDTSIRPSIEAKMNLQNSKLDPSVPFEFDDVVSAAEMIFKRDRFDFGVFDKPKPTQADSAYPRDEEEFTIDNLKKLLKSVIPNKEPSERPVLDPVQSRIVYDNLEREGEKAQKADEVETLIKQMSRLTIQDPNYAVCYFRIMKLDPDIGKLLAPPTFVNTPRMSSTSSTSPYTTTVPARPQTNFSEVLCYGCLQKGHTMTRCAQLAELANQGVVVRNDFGKWTMKDGRPIFRNPDESIVSAAKRLATPVVSTNLATIQVISDDDDDDGENIAFATDFDSAQVLAANRSDKTTKNARKEVFDSVTVPTVDQLKAKRIAEAKEKAKKTAEGARPNPVNPPRQPINPPHQPAQPIIVPATNNPPKVTTPPVFDPSNDDHIMEDVTAPPAKNTSKKATAPATRSSAVARHVDPFLVLNKVLNTELTLPVGELLGVSKEVSSRLTDLLKVTRNVETSTNSAVITPDLTPDSTSELTSDSLDENSVLLLRAQSPLIQVLVTCNGKSLMAIIDSGATQNICSAKCWKERINLPMDNKESVRMRDVHGNTSQMLGIVRNVPLTFGSVTTWANLFVSDQVHFDLLLGRPWFRDNLVNLNERKEGTYISFHDPEDPTRTLEFMATPDAGYAEGFLSASLMSSTDDLSPLDDPDLYSPVHEHPADLDTTEEDDLRERVNAQINPDLTNVEWRALQLLIAEHDQIEAQLDTIRGLLQSTVRTRFPWGHDIFQSSYSMYIGGGMTETHHRYEDYFLFHANRRSSIRHVPQPHGAAFVRWFPQEGTWDSLNTAREFTESQEPIRTTSSSPTNPIAPMGTPFETPSQSPILSPADNMPLPTPIEIHINVETVSVTSPPDPLADAILSFSRSPSPEHQTPPLEASPETTSMTPYGETLPLLSGMSELSIDERNNNPDHPSTQSAASANETSLLCAHPSSRVIENVKPGTSSSIITTPTEPGQVLEYQQFSPSPLSLSEQLYSISSPSSALSTGELEEKAMHVETNSDRSVSLMVVEIEEAPLPFMDAHFTLSPIPETVELPKEPTSSFAKFAFAPNVITPESPTPTVEPISDTVGWGMPAGEDYEDLHDGSWYIAAAEWEAMNRCFALPPREDIVAWNYGFDTQDQENAGEDNMDEDEDYMDENEELDAGTTF